MNYAFSSNLTSKLNLGFSSPHFQLPPDFFPLNSTAAAIFHPLPSHLSPLSLLLPPIAWGGVIKLMVYNHVIMSYFVLESYWIVTLLGPYPLASTYLCSLSFMNALLFFLQLAWIELKPFFGLCDSPFVSHCITNPTITLYFVISTMFLLTLVSHCITYAHIHWRAKLLQLGRVAQKNNFILKRLFSNFSAL